MLSQSPIQQPASAEEPTLWKTLVGFFRRTPVSASPLSSAVAPQVAAPAPLPPVPKAPSAPCVLTPPKGQRTALYAALDPSAPVSDAIAEMPRPGSMVPRIVLMPAAKFLQASRTVLSAFRKAPPARAAVAVDSSVAALVEPRAERFRPETRNNSSDFPII